MMNVDTLITMLEGKTERKELAAVFNQATVKVLNEYVNKVNHFFTWGAYSSMKAPKRSWVKLAVEVTLARQELDRSYSDLGLD